MKYKETFNATESLTLENSYQVIKTEENINLEVNLKIKSDTYGCFEFYNEDTSWYAEGGLWIENKKITDYDGVFELPPFILNKLESLGYDISEVK